MIVIETGSELWIGPELWRLAGHPEGFAFRVIDVLSSTHRGGQLLYGVRGVALSLETGLPLTPPPFLVLHLPGDQPRAVRQPQPAPRLAPAIGVATIPAEPTTVPTTVPATDRYLAAARQVIAQRRPS